MKFDFSGLPKDTKKYKYEYSKFKEIQVCDSCKWFNKPSGSYVFCCSDCGSIDSLKPIVGRYKRQIEVSNLFFFKVFKNISIIGFEPKI